MTTRRSFGAVRRLQSGRWQARYWDPSAATHLPAPLTFMTKGDANAWLAEKQTEMRRGVFVDVRASRQSLQELIRSHLDAELADGDLKPKTLDGYESLLRSCVANDSIGNVAASDLRGRDIREWVTRMRQRRLSASRVRQAYRLVSMVCRHAVRDDLLPRNPCDGVELPRLPEPRGRFLETEEVDRLVAAVPETQRSFILTLAYGGLRWGEAAALRVRDIDVSHSTMRIDESLSAATDPRTKKHSLTFETPKSRQSRTITVPTVVVDALVARMAELPMNPSQLLWTTRVGRWSLNPTTRMPAPSRIAR